MWRHALRDRVTRRHHATNSTRHHYPNTLILTITIYPVLLGNTGELRKFRGAALSPRPLASDPPRPPLSNAELPCDRQLVFGYLGAWLLPTFGAAPGECFDRCYEAKRGEATHQSFQPDLKFQPREVLT